MLDSNLFHLEVVRRQDGAVELCEPRNGGQATYAAVKHDETIHVGDPLSETNLASIKVDFAAPLFDHAPKLMHPQYRF